MLVILYDATTVASRADHRIPQTSYLFCYNTSGRRVRYSSCKARPRDGEEGFLGSEVWQFLVILLGFLMAAVLWLFVVYLPGRTLERWEDQRPDRGKTRDKARSKSGSAAGSGGQDGPSRPS
jgi:hypothetical protein